MKAQTIILGNVIFMKKLLYPFAAIVFAMLPALSCNKESAVKVVDLASLTADYEAKDGETLSGILGGNYKITIADGAVVTLKNAVIYGENNEAYKFPASLCPKARRSALKGTANWKQAVADGGPE